MSCGDFVDFGVFVCLGFCFGCCGFFGFFGAGFFCLFGFVLLLPFFFFVFVFKDHMKMV